MDKTRQGGQGKADKTRQGRQGKSDKTGQGGQGKEGTTKTRFLVKTVSPEGFWGGVLGRGGSLSLMGGVWGFNLPQENCVKWISECEWFQFQFLMIPFGSGFLPYSYSH